MSRPDEPDGHTPAQQSELQRLRLELDRSLELLERQQRRKASLLAMAAHDLRTPLAIIQGYAQLLAAEPAARLATTSEYIDNIIAHADSLGKMIENLITLDQLERGETRLTFARNDLNELVGDAIAQVEGLTKLKELSVHYQPSPLPIWVDADAEQTGRALYNLLSHAIKYARPGSELWVEVGRFRQFGRVTLRDPQRRLGADMIARLFHVAEINHDGPTSLRGMDMGLVLARRVADAHGGTVGATSEPERGTTLSLSLPASGE